MTKTNSTVRYTSFFGQGKYVHRRGFTLIELLIVMAIIGCIASALTVGLSRVQLAAKKKRCEQQVRKLHEIIMQHYEEVINHPLSLPETFGPKAVSMTNIKHVRSFQEYLLLCRREFIRRTLPDRKSDIWEHLDDAQDPLPGPLDNLEGHQYKLPNQYSFLYQLPNQTLAYQRTISGVFKATGKLWSPQYQGSECLYLILSTMQDGDRNALDFLLPSEITDLDNDGMPEITDSFGTPLGFIRWAPYYDGITDIQFDDGDESFDWTDLSMIDYRIFLGMNPKNLVPIIMSAGPDKEFGCRGFYDQFDQDLYDGLRQHLGEVEWRHEDNAMPAWRGGDYPTIKDGMNFPHDPFNPMILNPESNEWVPYKLGEDYFPNKHSDDISNHRTMEAN